ncbi:hypothetical protein M407DRAFT_12500 [Tulasnella calospora MUT 4182]|uniref:Uncharacterized protein n=1 Tax=Tulasnella calospora MUT 4182 TaxID=1051891 RepID=A0A0C3Q3C4_9AGAM|nr:hypothetical protein M407DRAFT_12500 [Tulasnella calospora MUT 4182]
MTARVALQRALPLVRLQRGVAGGDGVECDYERVRRTRGDEEANRVVGLENGEDEERVRPGGRGDENDVLLVPPVPASSAPGLAVSGTEQPSESLPLFNVNLSVKLQMSGMPQLARPEDWMVSGHQHLLWSSRVTGGDETTHLAVSRGDRGQERGTRELIGYWGCIRYHNKLLLYLHGATRPISSTGPFFIQARRLIKDFSPENHVFWVEVEL